MKNVTFMNKCKMDKVALIVVDNLNCFHSAGELPVPEAFKINEHIAKLQPKADLVVAVQEWHPLDHCSFMANGGPWPEHGVANTVGSMFHSQFDINGCLIFRKGQRSESECYGAFHYEDGVSTGLVEILEGLGITTVWVVGLATEYCVKTTALQAQDLGYKTVVFEQGIAGLEAERSQRTLKVMEDLGISIVRG